jgi:redox-sensitive bicupin YhaK (pirin superfamily)
MVELRKGVERGRTQRDWLDSLHSFSFADYYDPRRMGFRALRVINEDRVRPSGGFPTHGHRDMEIITYILSGALEHKDSLNHGSVIRRGEVQRMSAGTGIMHSEYNASRSEPVHFLQIWILPGKQGLAPGYEQRAFDLGAAAGLVPVATPDGSNGTLTIHQDAALGAALLKPGDAIRHEMRPGRHGWLQVCAGALSLNGLELKPGDGAAISEERTLAIKAQSAAEILFFDLA